MRILLLLALTCGCAMSLVDGSRQLEWEVFMPYEELPVSEKITQEIDEKEFIRQLDGYILTLKSVELLEHYAKELELEEYQIIERALQEYFGTVK